MVGMCHDTGGDSYLLTIGTGKVKELRGGLPPDDWEDTFPKGTSVIAVGWKEWYSDGMRQIQTAARRMGVFIKTDPQLRGGDQLGWIVSSIGSRK